MVPVSDVRSGLVLLCALVFDVTFETSLRDFLGLFFLLKKPTQITINHMV